MKDYSQRRPVNSTISINRPKKQGMARYSVLTLVGGLLAGFGIGLASGWVLFKPTRQQLNALQASAERGAAQPAPAATPPPKPTPGPAPVPVDPGFSFYKTLPSGKAVLGTGLNPAKPEDPVQAQPPPRPVASPTPTPRPQQPAARIPSLPTPPPVEHRDGIPGERSAVKAPTLTASPPPAPSPSGADQARKAQSKGKYVVQVASYQSKNDAEAVKERLIENGLSAYIVEWVLKEKGTMYRVRVGRHLELSAAEELAAKAGKNAIPVME